MTSKRKFYLQTFTVEVLSEDAPMEWDDLEDINYEISLGTSVGGPVESTCTEITPKYAADKLHVFQSDPEFFHLDDDGNDIS